VPVVAPGPDGGLRRRVTINFSRVAPPRLIEHLCDGAPEPPAAHSYRQPRVDADAG